MSGPRLTKNEKQLINKNMPFGFIIFSRNYESPNQIKELIREIHDLVGWNCPILVDQEGGRVQRLSEPYFLKYPPSDIFGNIAKFDISSAEKAVKLNYKLIGSELKSVGINVNCAPCLDLFTPEAHSVIGNRAFSDNPIIVEKLGKAACSGLLSQGVSPVIKHIPGHGKANKDSHKELPIIKSSLTDLKNNDFYPFKNMSQIFFAMTAHIIYEKIDRLYPITTSKKAYNYIRDNIKYEGILITDDIDMKALSGSIKDKIKSIKSAGYDIILHCSGNENEIRDVLNYSPVISKKIVEDWLTYSSNLIIEEIDFKNKATIINQINEILLKYLKYTWKFK